MKKRKAVYLAISLCFSSIMLASDFNVDFALMKTKYSMYNAVLLQKNKDVVIDIVQDSLHITQHIDEASLMLNSKSKVGTFDYVYYSSFKKVDNIKAITHVPYGKRYKKIISDKIRVSNDLGNSVFYDDSKQIEIIYPQISEGAITTLSYDEIITDPRFLNDFLFQTFIPIENSRLKVKVHKDVDLGMKLFNEEGFNIDYERKEKGKYIYHTWLTKEIKPAKRGNKYTRPRHFLPHVKLFLRSAMLNGKQVDYFNGIDALYKCYSGWVFSDDAKNYSSDLVKLVTSIAENCATQEEKAKAVYYWVQDNIKYVAFEDGMRGFIPHKASVVFSKRYGDCKDMSSLIVGMLDIAGVEAHYTWVGTRHIPYSYEELPTFSVDNHMVASVFLNNKWLVLDGTLSEYSFGSIPHHIQGKQLMVGLNKDEFEIVNIPVANLDYSSIQENAILTIDKKRLVGVGTKAFEGYCRYEIATSVAGLSSDRLERRMNNSLSIGSNKFQLKDFHNTNMNYRDSVALVRYKWFIDDYITSYGDEIYVNMNLDKSLAQVKLDTAASVAPIENDFCYSVQSQNTLLIPDGYQVSHLPENESYLTDRFGYRIEYENKDTAIVHNTYILYNFLVVKPEDYKDWGLMLNALNNTFRKTIALTRKNENHEK